MEEAKLVHFSVLLHFLKIYNAWKEVALISNMDRNAIETNLTASYMICLHLVI